MTSSSNNFFSGSSGYIFSRRADRYGGKQDDYIAKVDEIVKETVARIQQTVEEKSAITSLFDNVIQHMAASRKQLAMENKSANAEDFGVRTDDAKAFVAPSAITLLNDAYQEYNTRLIKEIQKDLKTMKYTAEEFVETEKKFPGKTCLGRKTVKEYLIITNEKISNHLLPRTVEVYKELCGYCKVDPTPDGCKDPAQGIHQLVSNKDMLYQIKLRSLEMYKKIKLQYTIPSVRRHFPNQRVSDWILVTRRCEIEGKMFALSQYLTWVNRVEGNDHVDSLTGNAVVALVHQDIFLLPEMLKEMAKVFKQAIEWDKQDLKTLQKTVALLVYEFSHAMPYKRGSAAISEWLEMAIFQYHGYRLSYNKNMVTNLEALVLPLDEFVEKYPTMMKLEKMTENRLNNMM